MVRDLRRALLKKEEIESARLTDFEFRETVRAMRLLAKELGLDPRPLLRELADKGEAAVLAALTEASGRTQAEVDTLRAQAHAAARRQLIEERGDPAPHRLG